MDVEIQMKYLIIGLGNVGAEYACTRHNIGFLLLDRMADESGVQFEQNRLGFKAEMKSRGRGLTLIKPTTSMNLSGKAVHYWLQQLKIPKEKLLVVTDDIALPFGKIRLKSRGSSGGHNGLKNIEEIIDGRNYSRLRFGVGNNFSKGGQVDYVLSPFQKEEMDELVGHMDTSIVAIESFCSIGLERTMNLFN